MNNIFVRIWNWFFGRNNPSRLLDIPENITSTPSRIFVSGETAANIQSIRIFSKDGGGYYASYFDSRGHLFSTQPRNTREEINSLVDEINQMLDQHAMGLPVTVVVRQPKIKLAS
jgi:hypothetical protein